MNFTCNIEDKRITNRIKVDKKMKILVIPSWYENNTNPTLGSFFREQAESLVDLGHEVYILYVDIIRFNDVNRMINTPKWISDEKNGIKIFRKKVVKFPKVNEYFVYKAVEKGIEQLYLRNILGKIDIDVIHAHSFVWGGCAATYLGKKYNIPVVVTEHYTGYSRKIFNKIEIGILKSRMYQADKIIAVSEGLKKDMIPYLKERKEIKIIPNMVDNDLFRFNRNTQTDSLTFTFITVCYLMHKKGIDILLKAFSQAFENTDNVKLIIAGDGEEKSNLISLAESLNLQDKVNFIGGVDRKTVSKLMQKSNCFVLPSRFETFGVVYIEALAVGLPVIATNTDAIANIVDNDNGIVVKKEDIDGLSNALIEIRKNYEKYNANKISESCVSKFGRRNVARQIESTLKETIKVFNKKGV